MKTILLMSMALVACGANEAATMPTTVTSAGIHVDVDPAVEQITVDRCNRQLSCGHVGKGLTWRDRRDCETDMKPKTRDLVGQSCKVIDAARLTTCIQEIRDQRCTDSGAYPASCQGVQLCR
jgi:hypothetical protein